MTSALATLKAHARNAARRAGLLGLVFRLHEVREARRHPRPPDTAPDGLALPDRLRMVRIGASGDWRLFYEGGEVAAEALLAYAEAAGMARADLTTVFDWGCGCGRIARHMLAKTDARVIGRDVDRFGVAWCAQHLGGDFAACALDPPTDLPDAEVDLAYGYSVFTHLPGPAQRAWLAELARVIRLGGLAILTFHDDAHPRSADVMRAEDGGVRVTETQAVGSNLVAAFQDLASIAEPAATWFEVARHDASPVSPFDQAVVVLRRR